MKSKKGMIQNLQPMVIALVAIGVVLAVGFLVLGEVQSNASVTANVNASQAVNETISAMGGIPGWLPIIIVTVIGVLLIGMIGFFGRRR